MSFEFYFVTFPKNCQFRVATDFTRFYNNSTHHKILEKHREKIVKIVNSKTSVISY